MDMDTELRFVFSVYGNCCEDMRIRGKEMGRDGKMEVRDMWRQGRKKS